MKLMLSRGVLTTAIAVMLACAVAAPALANDIRVDAVWAHETPPMAPTGAVYMTLSNTGTTDDRLVKVETDVADRAELHTHVKSGEVMGMRPVEAIDIPAGGTAKLEPGGLHIMLIDLSEPLDEGESFTLTLICEKAGPMTIEVPVHSLGATDHGKTH